MSSGALTFDPWAAIAAYKNRTLEPPRLAGLGGLGEGGTPTPIFAPPPPPSPELDGLAGLAGGVLPELISASDPNHPLIDHDAADAEAMVAFYATPGAVEPTEPATAYCFPCGKPVLLHDRAWSEAGGWCCAACLAGRLETRAMRTRMRQPYPLPGGPHHD